MDEQMKQILELFIQPTFFVEYEIITWCNSAARMLLPVGTKISTVLEKEHLLYSLWSHQGTLQLPLCICGEDYDASIRSMEGGDLFVSTRRTSLLNTTAATVFNVSASLRRPLHMMVGAASDLFEQMDENMEPSATAAASRLNQSIYQFMRLCGQMSDGGSLLLGRKEIRRTPADLNAFFTSFVAQARPLVESAGRTLHYTPPTVPLHGDADLSLLERALYNLLSNAINYTTVGGNITLSLHRQNRQLLVSVSDDGEGLSPEVRSTIFERFSERPLGDSRWGLGLGLPMVREIAHLHDGTMSIGANDAGRGTTVTFSLSMEPTALALRSRSVSYDYCGDFHHGLVELSDVLDSKMFDPSEVL